jgi:hypothetical protein
MPAPLRCPACAAPLEPSAVDGAHLRCPYCGSSARLRDGRPASPVGLAPAAGAGPGRAVALAIGGVLLALAGAGALLLRSPDQPDPPPAALTPPEPAKSPTGPTDGPLPPIVRFGRAGTGAGGLTDARAVAILPDGRILVGEYSGGRIQLFDSAGTFLTQWTADPRTPLLDLETDRAGNAYVVQGSRVRRFDPATGEARGELVPRGGIDVSDLAPALDGTFWAVSGQDALVRLGADGRVLRTVNLRDAVDEDAVPGSVAVTGDGELFVTDRWSGEVYRLHPDGRFADRFGTAVRGSGAFASIAVDGLGRVFVSGMGGIRVFDRSGTPLGLLGEPGVVFGIAVADERALLLGTYRNSNEVRGYRLPP